MSESDTLQSLVTMSRALGDPAHDYAIIGEGNSSARRDAETFYVKASGYSLGSIGPEGFVAVRFAPVLALFAQPDLPLAEQQTVISNARLDPAAPHPSLEFSLHAMLLDALPDVHYIGHTHPTAVNQILCSNRAEQFAYHCLFPDQITVCGPAAYIPYTPPGLTLARVIRDAVQAHADEHGAPPKLILMQNHGMIALGKSPREVLNITAMCVKAARVFAGACALGEPVFMTDEQVAHILHRPDEAVRVKLFS
ncbi:MAG: class II aldolase [Anaerolineae bacterium]|nr:class II aldolase [Anaerolineae bacterium]